MVNCSSLKAIKPIGYVRGHSNEGTFIAAIRMKQ